MSGCIYCTTVCVFLDLTYSPERLLQGICQYPIISATATAMSCQPSVNPFCKQVFTLGNSTEPSICVYVHRFTSIKHVLYYVNISTSAFGLVRDTLCMYLINVFVYS